jgi:hypothetical protein
LDLKRSLKRRCAGLAQKRSQGEAFQHSTLPEFIINNGKVRQGFFNKRFNTIYLKKYSVLFFIKNRI